MDPRGRSRGQQELVAAPALGRAGGRAATRGACAGARVGATPPAHPRTRSPHHPWHCRLHGAAWGQNGPLLSTWGCALSIFLSACSLLCLARLLATLVSTVPQLCRTGPSSLGSSAAPGTQRSARCLFQTIPSESRELQHINSGWRRVSR